ncbi:uncharacterized protein TNCV_4047381 [Trichonephila clavipes]|nr:uncharacterized protein TNCV_4047381 [Trichonephila clavipes]
MKQGIDDTTQNKESKDTTRCSRLHYEGQRTEKAEISRNHGIYRKLKSHEMGGRMEIGSRVGRNQTTVMRICDRWMQKGTTDQRGRSHPPQCITSREDRQIVRMAVTDHSVTSRTVALHIESVTHHSVLRVHSTPFTAERSVRKTSIAWSTLDAKPQTSPPPMV